MTRGLPSHSTTAFELKFVPVTLSVNAAPPATEVAGLIEAIVGAAAETEKFTAGDVALPELATVTANVPAFAKLVVGTCACNAEPLTIVVVSALPLNCTVEPPVKFAPMTFSANAGPFCTALAGERAHTTGTPDFDTVNDILGEKINPPTPFGVYTVTVLHPAVRMSEAVIAAVS